MKRLAALAAVAGCAQAAYPVTVDHPLLGHALPAIDERALAGGRVAAASGRPVVVKFFAKSCRACRTTLPAAEHLHETYEDVAFVGVSEDGDEDEARALVREYHLTFPVVLDETGKLSASFRVRAIPTTFVADRSGTVRWIGTEDQSEDDLRRAIRAAR